LKTKKRGRPTKKDPSREAKLLKALALGHTDRTACQVVGIGVQTPSDWKERDPEFAAKCERAALAVVDKTLGTINAKLECPGWRFRKATRCKWSNTTTRILDLCG